MRYLGILALLTMISGNSMAFTGCPSATQPSCKGQASYCTNNGWTCKKLPNECMGHLDCSFGSAKCDTSTREWYCSTAGGTHAINVSAGGCVGTKDCAEGEAKCVHGVWKCEEPSVIPVAVSCDSNTKPDCDHGLAVCKRGKWRCEDPNDPSNMPSI
jgi:hypothetical protein